jgi:hypothetical protein
MIKTDSKGRVHMLAGLGALLTSLEINREGKPVLRFNTSDQAEVLFSSKTPEAVDGIISMFLAYRKLVFPGEIPSRFAPDELRDAVLAEAGNVVAAIEALSKAKAGDCGDSDCAGCQGATTAADKQGMAAVTRPVEAVQARWAERDRVADLVAKRNAEREAARREREVRELAEDFFKSDSQTQAESESKPVQQSAPAQSPDCNCRVCVAVRNTEAARKAEANFQAESARLSEKLYGGKELTSSPLLGCDCEACEHARRTERAAFAQS